MAGIYIHIPFCKQACHYCDFHFSTSPELIDQMTQAIAKELSIRQPYLGEQEVTSIYFGGGTPSLLTGSHLGQLLGVIYQYFNVNAEPEITFESNPDDLHKSYLEMLARIGINRLSIGVQSFDNRVLKWMNRVHDQQQALGCINMAREAGFSNLNIDLIFGLPMDRDLRTDLEIGLKMEIPHFSTYHLTIEPGTVFGYQVRQGLMKPLEEDKAAAEFEFLINSLTAGGYEHYEISNFSLPGMASRHNSSYWKQEPYLGVGPSAHSYDLQSRQYNVANNKKYLIGMENNHPMTEIEYLSRPQKANELIMTGLRTSWGLDLSELEQLAGPEAIKINEKYLQSLKQEGLALITKNKVILTTRGKLIADRIASDLFLDT